jgi:integrase
MTRTFNTPQSTSSVRNHGANPKIGLRLDPIRGTESRRLSVSEPDTIVPTSVDSAIRENLVEAWVTEIGLDAGSYGTHTMRRTKTSLIYRRTRNLRALQLLLGHSKLENTVRYLGIEVEDALEMAEQPEV